MANREKLATTRQRSQARLDAGLCPLCTAPLAFGRLKCKGCLSDQRAANRARLAKWASAGRCLKCGHSREDARLQCNHCRAQDRAYKKKYRADGFCLRCGGFKKPGRLSCERCLTRRRDAQRLRRAKVSEKTG